MSLDLSTRYARYTQYQTVSWKKRTGYDGNGDPSYADAANISVRSVGKRTMVKTVSSKLGQTVISDRVIMTTDDVGPQDLIDDVIVINTEDVVDLKGTIIGRLAYL